MNFERFTQNLLALDNRIVFVGIVNGHSQIDYSTFREEVQLHLDQEAIKNLFSLAPQLTMDESEKTKPVLGQMSTVLVIFAKRVLVLSRFNEYIILVGLDAEFPTPLPDLIAALIRTAASEAPDLLPPLQTVMVAASSED